MERGLKPATTFLQLDIIWNSSRAVSSAGRARRSQRRGRGFESLTVHSRRLNHFPKTSLPVFDVFLYVIQCLSDLIVALAELRAKIGLQIIELTNRLLGKSTDVAACLNSGLRRKKERDSCTNRRAGEKESSNLSL